MVKGPSFLSLLSCPRGQVSESLDRSGRKRRLGWNLGEHRQGTALWQHVQRYRHQVHHQVRHQVHLIFYALCSSPRCAGVSCYLWHAIPLPVKTSSGSIFFKFEKFQTLQNPLECLFSYDELCFGCEFQVRYFWFTSPDTTGSPFLDSTSLDLSYSISNW